MGFADHDEEVAEGLVLQEATIADLAAAMQDGRLTAEALVARYLDRIARLDRQGPALRSVLEVNPDALEVAARLDRERSERGPRRPLHGIPVPPKAHIHTPHPLQT